MAEHTLGSCCRRLPRHQRKAGGAPGADAAVDADDVFVAHRLEVRRRERRAVAAAAIEQQLGTLVGHTGFDIALDDALAEVDGAGEVVLRPLALFAHVDEEDAGAGDLAPVHAGLEVMDGALADLPAGGVDEGDEGGAVVGHGSGIPMAMRAVVTALAALTLALAACPGEVEDGGLGEPLPQGWTTLCEGVDVGACLGDGPLQCGEAGPPRAACETCGCPGGDACVVSAGDDGVCASRAVREAVRDDDAVSDALADDVYLALWTLLEDETRAPLPLQDWLDLARRQAEGDGRQRVVVVGREDGDRGDVVVDALRSAGASDMGLDDAVDIPCGGRAEAAVALAIPDIISATDLVIDVGAVDDAHSGLCAFPGSVARCVLPHRASCLARGGVIPQTLVVVDDDVFLARLDDVLVRSVARVGRDQWEQRLDSVIATFAGLVLRHRPEARFAVDDERDDEVRVVEVPPEAGSLDPALGTLALAWLPRFDVKPVRGIAFRALWLDGPTRVFLTDHDVVPADCDFAPGLTDVVEVVCVASDGAVVEATVDAARAALIDIDTTAP